MSVESKMVLYGPNGEEVKGRGTRRGELIVTKRIPDFASLVMADKVWQVQDLTTTAALVAPPTVTGNLTVQNPTDKKYYVVFALKAYTDVVPAGLGMVSLWHCAHKLPIALLTRDISLQATGAGAISGLKAGQGGYPGQIVLDRGATVVDDGWSPVGRPLESNIATTNFVSIEIPLIVPVIIPPGLHYSVQTLATVVTYETGIGLVWAELDEEDVE